MNLFISVLVLITLQPALARQKVSETLRSLNQTKDILGAKEGRYEVSTGSPDPLQLCDKQVADLEWIRSDQKITLVIGPRLSFSSLQTDRAEEVGADGCVTTSVNKIEKHRLVQTIASICAKNSSEGFTNKHSLEFSDQSVSYSYQHEEPHKKPVKTQCYFKFLGPKENPS